jgi:hypothetical protein
MILNVYALNISVPKFIKQTFLNIKEQMDPHAVIMGHLIIPAT